ncbi:MAG: protein-L-isoaspartate(D-aspartate) O-methyltransferase [candidate division KSB1 bacterium]|nr:protein-L-isoaspartate(D-aspartate) O-methyltransferase [candidate division KSB1 bacterium]MDZ7368730.1 protein-L-isoaspartate(D-aspartate) O-methyltransferase [candidate division KSB1 bacterium]MDZ7406453.1 protein-L-isoaspartate(D-aspartate) O-methyltransferase [candidate division KSB1 bacterium]
MKWQWWEEPPQSEAEYATRRSRMVETQLQRRGIHDERVLAAMREVPRHLFVPEIFRRLAYDDSPVPIGYEQTISQPFIVAYMLQYLKLSGSEKVLEIGAGSGYQTVLLSHLSRKVYAIEIIQELAAQARKMMNTLGIRNARIRCSDGYLGWPEAAPFDRIIVSAAPGHVPQNLLDQLRPSGRMILPLGDFDQRLMVLRKAKTGKVYRRKLVPVKFVPMTGLAEKVN